jgi:hypothetical protein
MRALLLVIVLGLLAAATAHAEPTVLAIDGKDIYIDLGAKDGVGAGSELDLLHEIVATDPRTGTVLRDHFALGKLVVARAGDRLCVAHADDELIKRVLVGDHAQLASQKRAFTDPWEERIAAAQQLAAPPAAPGAPPIDHAALARNAWRDTLGQPPEQRIARWQKLMADDPQTPYHRAIAIEIGNLRGQISLRDAALAKARSGALDDTSPRIADLVRQLGQGENLLLTAPVARSVPGRAIALAFLARTPAQVGRAWLYVRRHGEPGYRRLELVRDGDAYLRATIDPALVQEPGVEWYVETAKDGEEAHPVIGTHEMPNVIDVEQMVGDPPPQPGRSHVDLHVDYVDWQGKLNKGYDHYYQAEADFMYRFLDPVYAVRLGFGTLSGIGGPKDVIDNDPTGHCIDSAGNYRCTRVTFSYVYAEMEYRLLPNVAVMIRPQAGMLTADEMPTDSTTRCDSGDQQGCRFLTGFGARARLRLGEESGTNLVLGAGFTKGVGTLLEAAYHWLPAEVVPVQITVQVTDQPVVEDFGVRLIGDVGYRRLNWFYPSVRVSYQARDIRHTGVSGGLAMNFDW